MTDIATLIELQIGKSFHEAWKEIDSEAARQDSLSKARDKRISEEARVRRVDLGRVLFWFHNCGKADGIKAHHWDALHKLAKSLVERGDLKPEALVAFNY
jgi:hypothetical protein